MKEADKSTGEDIWQLLLGKGKVDYATIFEWLVGEEWDGSVSAESHREPDAQLKDVDIIKHEYDALRALLKKAEGSLNVDRGGWIVDRADRNTLLGRTLARPHSPLPAIHDPPSTIHHRLTTTRPFRIIFSARAPIV